jgi:hypothetical protein
MWRGDSVTVTGLAELEEGESLTITDGVLPLLGIPVGHVVCPVLGRQGRGALFLHQQLGFDLHGDDPYRYFLRPLLVAGERQGKAVCIRLELHCGRCAASSGQPQLNLSAWRSDRIETG